MMALKTARKEALSIQRHKRRREPSPSPLWSRERLPFIGTFVGFTLLLILVCFVGLSPAGPQVVKGQVARVRVIAEFPFSYTSEIETERARAEMRQRIPPVYRLEQEPYEEFRGFVLQLNEALNDYLAAPGMELEAAEGPQQGLLKVSPEEMVAFLNGLENGNRYNLNSEDLAALANTLSRQQRADAINESLRVLADLYRQGVYDREHSQIKATTGSLSFFNLEAESGEIDEVAVLSEEQAVSDLKINLSSMEVPRDAFVALFRIMRTGLEPNLVFDQQRTNEIIEQAVGRLEPRVVNVTQGETIIEPNTRVTGHQFEQLQAYREELREREAGLGFDSLLFERSLLSVGVIICVLLFLQIQRNDVNRYLRNIVFAGLITVFNLALVRLLFALGEGRLAQEAPGLVLVLPWAAPVALGPILIAILLGSPAGAVAAGFVAVFVGIMQGSSLAVITVTMLSALTGVYSCRGVQVRARVVRAGVLAGCVMATCAVFMAMRESPESVMYVLMQMLAAILSGFISGAAVVGLIPVLENFFRHTTDITLLELTDFNHPLLRRMQVTAPGSYHHSLMVANLAENAAARVGANPLICRVAALYHDIGKLVKPEYFIENQREANPHMERNPSMSALIIKAHVKEGVILARQYHLPKVIVDVIQQHHGTTLIQYFYYMALQRQQDLNAGTLAPAGTCKVELDEVSESTYRYEGPRPQSIESAIIMLADSIEASSRSLKKVTPQSVEDFVDRIVQGRIDDGQLDEVPITLQQIAVVRESFHFTLLNMLHSRIEYPKSDKDGSRRPSRAPFGGEGKGSTKGDDAPEPKAGENVQEEAEKANEKVEGTKGGGDGKASDAAKGEGQAAKQASKDKKPDNADKNADASGKDGPEAKSAPEEAKKHA